MPLPRESWLRLKEVFDRARALAPDARPAYLDGACQGDETLQREVEALLAHSDQAASFLETPAGALTETVAARRLEGRRIGAYEISDLIGTGGMGEVYSARDTRLNRLVAIKVLLPAVAGHPQRLERFTREAQLLASLNHPHIAQIHGFENAGGVHALVMELVEGQTLADRVAQGAIPVDEALPIAKQIAEALEAAHAQGIIHRDLKPANIKVRPDGTVKVLDFGLAKAIDSTSRDRAEETHLPVLGPLVTGTGMIIGTAAYMSAEQATGRPVDKRTDVWAFGVVLLEMLTGRRVFTGETVAEVITAVLTIEPDWTKLPAETPGPIRALLQSCLEKDPAHRLDSATAVRLEIEAALTTAAPERVAEQRIRAWRRKMSARLATAAVAVVLIAGGGLWRLWRQDFFWRNPLEDAAIERITDFEGNELDAAISPDGNLAAFLSDRDGPFDVWVTQIGSGAFVNLTKGQFQLTDNRATRQTGFSHDGTRVWFLQQVAKRALGWTSWTAPAIGGSPRTLIENGLNPVWSPDGTRLVYHSADPGDPIFIADANGNRSTKVFQSQPGIHNHFPVWSPDGRDVYFVSGALSTEDMDIWRISVASGAAAAPERITSHHAAVSYPAWLDPRTLIYAATADDGSGQWLYAIDVEHRIPHRVSSGIAEQYLSVAVSNSQPRRVIAAVAIPTASLWSVPIAAGVQTEEAVTRVATANSRASGPRFATGYIAYLSSKGGANGLWKDEAGVAQEIWRSDDGGVVAPPAISPDGRRISFAARRRGTTTLYVMNANGTNVRALADPFDVRGPASWSPDGNWIAVAANAGQGTRVFKIPVSGGPPVQLVSALSVRPLWSPDGKSILYAELLAAGGDELKAVTPEGMPVAIRDTRLDLAITTTYRFVADGTSLIALEGAGRGTQNFFRIDLQTGERRQLTDLKGGSAIQNFDVSPDGKQIVFDRVADHSDIVLLHLAR